MTDPTTQHGSFLCSRSRQHLSSIPLVLNGQGQKRPANERSKPTLLSIRGKAACKCGRLPSGLAEPKFSMYGSDSQLHVAFRDDYRDLDL